jgi:hypothetical protein
MRTVAEILRRVSAKADVDDEARDMFAALVYLLREIHETALVTIEAWEKRGYWMKADRFMREWEWAAELAANFEDVIRNDAWDLIPRLMADLAPHTSAIQVKNMTRSPTAWRGAHEKLLAEPARDLPY